jgi:hypothetical protein
MVKFYGLFGLVTMIFAEIALQLKIRPFVSFFCPLIWLGYILLVDNLVYMLKHDSLMTRHPKKIISLFTFSVVFWTIFEIYNLFVPGWQYLNIQRLEKVAGFIAFSTIIPAIFETAELLKSVHLFDEFKMPNIKPINKNFLRFSMVIGAMFLILPFFFTGWWVWIMIWTSFFFFLDPINYLNKQPSIFRNIKNGNWKIPLSLAFAGVVCGFLWEWWNWGSVARWQYILPDVPLKEIKIFEMPILGYLGYIPFAWELYAMYNFVRFLFLKED